MRSWYLIHSKPQQEYLAKENLERQGYDTYLPLAPVRRRRRGRSYTRPGPMFPRYLFICLDDGVDDWGPVRSTIGVSSLVRFGQAPSRIPDKLILGLREREDADGIQKIEYQAMKKGDKVRIAEGPFEGYEGIFEANHGRERVVILLQFLEKQARLEITPDKIEAIC